SAANYVRVDLLALDDSAADTSGLEALLKSRKVYRDGSLGQGGDPLYSGVVQRADRIEGHILLDELTPVVIQVYLVLVFRQFHTSIPCFPAPGRVAPTGLK